MALKTDYPSLPEELEEKYYSPLENSTCKPPRQLYPAFTPLYLGEPLVSVISGTNLAFNNWVVEYRNRLSPQPSIGSEPYLKAEQLTLKICRLMAPGQQLPDVIRNLQQMLDAKEFEGTRFTPEQLWRIPLFSWIDTCYDNHRASELHDIRVKVCESMMLLQHDFFCVAGQLDEGFCAPFSFSPVLEGNLYTVISKIRELDSI